MIWVIDDDLELVKVIFDKYREVKYFTNAIAAINATSEEIPDLIFLDILLDGPDGFTFLNELQSYEDLAKVPVVIMTSLDLSKISGDEMGKYGIVGVLNKSEMTPEQIDAFVRRANEETNGGN